MKFLYAAIGFLNPDNEVVITPVAKQTVEEAHQVALEWASNVKENDGFKIIAIRVDRVE